MKAMETSKKITWIFIIMYIILVVLSLLGLEVYPIFNSVEQITMIIVVSYFSTKTIENYPKIKNNPDYDINNYINEISEGEDI